LSSDSDFCKIILAQSKNQFFKITASYLLVGLPSPLFLTEFSLSGVGPYFNQLGGSSKFNELRVVQLIYLIIVFLSFSLLVPLTNGSAPNCFIFSEFITVNF